MGYLCMAGVVGAWVVLAFIYRWADRIGSNRLYLAGGMGLAGVLWTLVWTLAGGHDLGEAASSQWLIGCGMGLMAAIGIPLFMACVARGDLSITWTVLTLSFGLASVLVMVYPGERPTPAGAAGLVTAAVAVALLGLDMVERHRTNGPGKPRKGWFLFMGISFLTNAITLYGYSLEDAALKRIEGDLTVQRLAFFVAMYGMVSAVGLLLGLFGPKKGSAFKGLLSGTIVGTLLLFGGILTLLTLGVAKVPGYVFYPATSGGSSILVVVLSVILLRERPGRWGWMGIATGTVALVLLGWAA